MIRLTTYLALFLVSLVLASCEGGSSSGNTVPPVIPPPASITISGTVLDGPVVGGTIFCVLQK